MIILLQDSCRSCEIAIYTFSIIVILICFREIIIIIERIISRMRMNIRYSILP